jgi:hypothetical protein
MFSEYSSTKKTEPCRRGSAKPWLIPGTSPEYSRNHWSMPNTTTLFGVPT